MDTQPDKKFVVCKAQGKPFITNSYKLAKVIYNNPKVHAISLTVSYDDSKQMILYPRVKDKLLSQWGTWHHLIKFGNYKQIMQDRYRRSVGLNPDGIVKRTLRPHTKLDKLRLDKITIAS